jgi:hypothetical protein
LSLQKHSKQRKQTSFSRGNYYIQKTLLPLFSYQLI